MHVHCPIRYVSNALFGALSKIRLCCNLRFWYCFYGKKNQENHEL